MKKKMICLLVVLGAFTLKSQEKAMEISNTGVVTANKGFVSEEEFTAKNSVVVEGILNVNDNVNINSDETNPGNLTVDGTITGKSDVMVTGSVTAGSGLTVTGAVTANNNLNIKGDLQTTGSVTVSGAVTANNSLTVKENLTASKDLDVNGSVTAGGELTVTGAVTAQSGVTVTGGIQANGTVTVNGAVHNKSSLTVEGNTQVKGRLTNGAGTTYDAMPVGTILMYNGSSWNEALMPGWKVCNGANGTPNLTGRFIRGGASAGAAGGSDTVTLGVNNLPSHSHSMNHDHPSINTPEGEGAHMHKRTIGSTTGNVDNPNVGLVRRTTLSEYNPGAGTHTHTVNIPNYTGNTGYTGSNQAFSIVPSYYTVIYIMKVN